MIWEIVLLILAIPSGYLIAWMAKDELKDGQRWFRVLFIASVLLAGLFYLLGDSLISLTCLFISIVGLVSLMKSNDKKWTKKRV